jgi:lipoprotein-anchoring transpeptidase ErfK/SrfK
MEATPAHRADRRAARAHRARIRALVAGAIVVVMAGAAGGWVFLGGREAHKPRHRAAPTTVPATTAVAKPLPLAIVGTTKVKELVAYQSPSESAPSVAKLSDKTEYGFFRTVLVVDDKSQPGWLQALLPMQPNGTKGWIRVADLQTTTTDYSIKIELGAHKVTLFKSGQALLASEAVIGSQQTPTPLGAFFVTDPVNLEKTPNGAYGAFALGLSGYSETLKEFKGGPPQIALHGTSQPDQVGQDISNGCVRVPNDVILQIANQVPLGTPVQIIA